MAERLFTVAEADTLVSFLEGHLRRLQDLQRQAQDHFGEMEKIKAIGYRPDGKLILQHDFEKSREAFERSVAEANARIADINRCGCQLKSVEIGLVDFPSIIGETRVLLCWKLGEESVRFFHAALDGFDGRRALPEKLLPQSSGENGPTG